MAEKEITRLLKRVNLVYTIDLELKEYYDQTHLATKETEAHAQTWLLETHVYP
jgi:hypothetical protein